MDYLRGVLTCLCKALLRTWHYKLRERSIFRVTVLIPILPLNPAEVKVKSENGPPNSHIGGIDFCWSGSIGTNSCICIRPYQILNSLSSLPSKNIAS
jgi:hypothetical protein